MLLLLTHELGSLIMMGRCACCCLQIQRPLTYAFIVIAKLTTYIDIRVYSLWFISIISSELNWLYLQYYGSVMITSYWPTRDHISCLHMTLGTSDITWVSGNTGHVRTQT